ncbi:mitochondrial PGP phosphatase [Lipomyces arxii]|uniref:mitochondrial PGP phosphatase n=1 Tax=Lipomyces arxii TaxID=56418 RepID=UPI0034CDD5CF
MSSFNLPATLHTFRLLTQPHKLVPALRVPTFNDLPIPLAPALVSSSAASRQPDIQAIVLDKDNCFTAQDSPEIYPLYKAHFAKLRQAYPGDKLLIVSNTAGTKSMDPDDKLALALEHSTGVRVLRHVVKKPDCVPEIMRFFKSSPSTGVERPEQVAVVGDRILTDVVMANEMGAWAIWIETGVKSVDSLPGRVERVWLRAVEHFNIKTIRSIHDHGEK